MGHVRGTPRLRAQSPPGHNPYFSHNKTHNKSRATSHGQVQFSEQLVRLDSLGLFFARAALTPPPPPLVGDSSDPVLDYTDEILSTRPDAFYASLQTGIAREAAQGDLARLIGEKRKGAKLILCPQHLAKLPPSFDFAIKEILGGVPNAMLILWELFCQSIPES